MWLLGTAPDLMVDGLWVGSLGRTGVVAGAMNIDSRSPSPPVRHHCQDAEER